MSATRWSLIPITPTLYMLCPWHDGPSFPSPLPYICYVRSFPSHLPYIWYVRDTVVSHSHLPYHIYAMSATRWSLIPITPTLYMLCPRHGGLSFPSPLPYICYVRDTVVSHSHLPYLIYAMSATRWSLIPISPTIYMLCPRHSGLSFSSPLPYICYVPNTVVSHSHLPYHIYTMSATRWSLIPISPTLYMLCPRHSGLSFPSPLPYICYVCDTVVSHSHLPYLIYAMSATQWSLILISPTIYMLCPQHGGLSFPSPLPYIYYVSDTVVSHSHLPYLIYAMSATQWSLLPISPTIYMLCLRHSGLSFPSPLPYICYVRDTVVSHYHLPYHIYAMSATRWSLIPISPTIYMLCPRHSGL